MSQMHAAAVAVHANISRIRDCAVPETTCCCDNAVAMLLGGTDGAALAAMQLVQSCCTV